MHREVPRRVHNNLLLPTKVKLTVVASRITHHLVYGYQDSYVLLATCLALDFSHFMKRSLNKGTTDSTGDKANCGEGYGQKIPTSTTSMGQRHTFKAKAMLSGDHKELHVRVQSPCGSGLPSLS